MNSFEAGDVCQSRWADHPRNIGTEFKHLLDGNDDRDPRRDEISKTTRKHLAAPRALDGARHSRGVPSLTTRTRAKRNAGGKHRWIGDGSRILSRSEVCTILQRGRCHSLPHADLGRPRGIGWWSRFAGSRRLGTYRSARDWFGSTLPNLIIAAVLRTASVATSSKAGVGAIDGWFGAQMARPTSTSLCPSSRLGHGRYPEAVAPWRLTSSRQSTTDGEQSGLVSVELEFGVGSNVGSQEPTPY